MRSALAAGLVFLVTICNVTDSAAQGPSSPDLAAEQVAFGALARGGGACDANFGCPDIVVPVLMDVDETHVIPVDFSPATRGAWSPDGSKVLTASEDIFVAPVVGGPSINLTNRPARYVTPAWSHDGKRIAFASDRDGGMDLYTMNADGSGVVRIVAGLGSAWYPTWSPDSKRIAFTCIVDPVPSPFVGNSEICVINADGSGFARLTADPALDDEPDWSPD